MGKTTEKSENKHNCFLLLLDGIGIWSKKLQLSFTNKTMRVLLWPGIKISNFKRL